MAMTEEEELEQLMQEAVDERDSIDESGEEEIIEEEEVVETKEENNEEIEPEEKEPELEESGEEEIEVKEEIEEELEKPNEEQVSDFTPIEIEVSGHKVTINSQDEMMEYIKKGAGTFNKEPETHQEEKLVIEQGKLSSDDLKLLVEAKNGSKEAIAKLAQLGKVDLMEIDDDSAESYKQQVQYNAPSDVDKVASEIMRDTAHATEVQSVFKNLPQDFTQAVSQDASMLKQFSEHIRNGIAQEIIPKAINASMTNGKSFLQNYAEIGQSQHDAKQESTKQIREVSDKEKQLRDRANSSKGVQNSKPVAVTADDIDDMDDATFKEYTSDPSNFKD